MTEARRFVRGGALGVSTAGAVALAVLALGCGGSTQAAPAPVAPVTSEPPRAAARPDGGRGAANDDLGRATSAIKGSDFKSAHALLEKVLARQPKNATALYYLGLCLENEGDKKEAASRYREALSASPDLVEAAVNLGALELDDGQWDAAAAVTKSALARRPDDPALHANLAVALRGKGDTDGALAHYARAVQAQPDNANLRFGYGSLLLEKGNKEKAGAELKAAAGAAGSDRALLASIGRLLGPTGAYAECIVAFDRAIALGDDAELRVRRGICRHGLKDEGGAKADFETALQLNPRFAPAHYYLGESLASSGDAVGALRHFDATVEAVPDGELGQKAKEHAEELRKKKGAKR